MKKYDVAAYIWPADTTVTRRMQTVVNGIMEVMEYEKI